MKRRGAKMQVGGGGDELVVKREDAGRASGTSGSCSIERSKEDADGKVEGKGASCRGLGRVVEG